MNQTTPSTALDVLDDHATSCYAHIPARCIPLCHKNYARVARPSLRVLVMQYIQRCRGSGLVHETRGGGVGALVTRLCKNLKVTYTVVATAM